MLAIVTPNTLTLFTRSSFFKVDRNRGYSRAREILFESPVPEFGSRQMRAKLQLHSLPFMGKDIVPSDTAKNLGVILDYNLTYDEHIIKIASSCMSRLGQINRVKHVFDKRTLLTIINSLVFSKLFYCSNVWANTSKCNINKL